jgi:hypothetical protein
MFVDRSTMFMFSKWLTKSHHAMPTPGPEQNNAQKRPSMSVELSLPTARWGAGISMQHDCASWATELSMRDQQNCGCLIDETVDAADARIHAHISSTR